MKKNVLIVSDGGRTVFVCPYCHRALTKRGPCPVCGGEADWHEFRLYDGEVKEDGVESQAKTADG